MSRPVRRVAIVGRDAALWIMALGLKRSLTPIGVEVQAVELPSALTPGAVHAALPALANLHKLLGLKEEALFALCGAAPSLGQQYVGWSRQHPDFVLGYDVDRPAINDVDFVQFWSLATRAGMQASYEAFSLAATAARQGRVLAGKSGSGRSLSPGYHLDAQLYSALLRKGCASAGVEIAGTGGIEAEREGERIAAVRLTDGRRIEADLFVDASGDERVLIGSDGFESWAAAFPADTLFTGALPPLDPPPAHARIAATSSGWAGLFPLQNGTAVTGHLAGGGDGDAAAAALLAEAGIAGATNVTTRPFSPGMLRRGWIGNCVAVGDAGATLERLDAVELHLIQVALSNLVARWPVDAEAMPEAADYDRAMARHIGNIRDFQQAHYRLSDRAERFWLQARSGDAPDRLAGRLALFGARGMIAHFDDETFLPQSWAAMLIGHGIVPAESDPAVARTPEAEQMGKVRQLLHEIAQDVRAMPTTAQFIAAHRGGR